MATSFARVHQFIDSFPVSPSAHLPCFGMLYCTADLCRLQAVTSEAEKSSPTEARRLGDDTKVSVSVSRVKPSIG